MQGLPHATPSSPKRAAKRSRRASPSPPSSEAVRPGSKCPYMDTINRATLDFDLPPICSISLQSHNVYICLVCGKYLQGRSPSSHAYAHSLSSHHHLYLNLSTHAVHCLPDNYRITDPSLLDLPHALHPTFTNAQISSLDTIPRRLRMLDATSRLAGAVPLDGLQRFSYATSVLQLLLRAAPLRDFLLLHHACAESGARPPTPPTSDAPAAQLSAALAALTAKLWATHAYRAHVAPHQLVHLVSRLSNSRFSQTRDADPVDFAAWLLNQLAPSRGRKKDAVVEPMSRVVEGAFRGQMRVTTFPDKGEVKTADVPFWFLPLDLPPKPLFKDASERTLVAQVPLRKLLSKFDGLTRQHVVKANAHRSYEITRLPPCLMLVVRRFSKSNFGVQKNPCVVHLPAEGLDLSEICAAGKGRRYRLVAAIVHEGTPEKASYRVVIRHDATKSWYDLADMEVKPTMEQLVALADTYVLLYAPAGDLEPDESHPLGDVGTEGKR